MLHPICRRTPSADGDHRLQTAYRLQTVYRQPSVCRWEPNSTLFADGVPSLRNASVCTWGVRHLQMGRGRRRIGG